MRNEGDVKKKVRAVLDACTAKFNDPYTLWYFMPAANGYGRQGIPDFVGFLDGRGFVIETKFGSNQCTPYQMREIEHVTHAGGKAWIVRETTLDSFAEEFNNWVDLLVALRA